MRPSANSTAKTWTAVPFKSTKRVPVKTVRKAAVGGYRGGGGGGGGGGGYRGGGGGGRSGGGGGYRGGGGGGGVYRDRGSDRGGY